MTYSKSNIDILRQYFNKNSFRDKQEDVIINILNKKNTLCLMPTGLGKSIIFQVAGIQLGKTVIVISPLIALMNQQARKLNEIHITALSLNSDSGDSKKQYKLLEEFFSNNDGPKFIYISPEKIFLDGYLEYILQKYRDEISLIVIDEIHCVSQWGYNFRPSYKLVMQFLTNIFGKSKIPVILGLTATINKKDQKEVCDEFNIKQEDIIRSNTLLRDNIKIYIEEEVANNATKEIKLKTILDRHPDDKIIVYTHIKAREYGTKKMTEKFQALGYNCLRFDADLTSAQKQEVMQAFEKREVKIVFATSAFGMGIDIPDIRVIIHYLVPESVEQYYQEIGRCGRDGKESYAYLLYSATNFKVREDLIENEFSSIDDIKKVFCESIKHKKYDPKSEFSYGSLSLYDQNEDKKEFILFYHLFKYGFIKIKSKGFSDLRCLEETFPNSKLSKYKKHSVIASPQIISQKTATDISKISSDIFDEMFQGKAKLVKTPNKTLYFRIVREPDDNDFQMILKDIDERTKYRKNGFLDLKELILKNKDNPEQFMKKYFTY